MILVIHVDALHIVHVAAHEVSVRAPNRPIAVGNGKQRAGAHRHHAVIVEQCRRALRVHAGFVRDHRGLHAGDAASAAVTADRHIDEIQRIHADIKQRAACKLRVDDSLLVCCRIAQVRANRAHIADGAVLDQPANHCARRHVPCPNRLGAQPSGLPGHVNHMLRLLGVDRECFLHQHMLAGFHARDRLLGVQRMRGRDVHEVDFRVIQHLRV